MDMSLLFILLLALAIGWAMGRYERKKHQSNTSLPSLDMLAGERHSETMQAILNMAQQQEALELQLNLGAFYRRRGELDKAISIHQNLFARPDLDKPLSEQVQLALASDYLKAGLFDRAERLLKELLKSHSTVKVQAIEKLIVLYEEEQDWQAILNLASESKLVKNKKAVAYACCELAQQAMDRQDWRQMGNFLDRALKIDGQCVRAIILQGRLAQEEGFPNKMVARLKEALHYQPNYLPLVLADLKATFESRHRPQELEKLLEQLWINSPSPLTLHSYAEHLAKFNGADEAISQLAYSIADVPTIEGFALLIDKLIENNEPLSVSFLQRLQDIMARLTQNENEHRCQSCGFESDRHYWRCPSCKQWETLMPVLAQARLGGHISGKR